MKYRLGIHQSIFVMNSDADYLKMSISVYAVLKWLTDYLVIRTLTTLVKSC